MTTPEATRGHNPEPTPSEHSEGSTSVPTSEHSDNATRRSTWLAPVPLVSVPSLLAALVGIAAAVVTTVVMTVLGLPRPLFNVLVLTGGIAVIAIAMRAGKGGETDGR